MIICSCNVLTDDDVRGVAADASVPVPTAEVYTCLGCSAQCGRCARTIKRIMNDVLASCSGRRSQ
jgi:bacterioferritin-associated ferredoxin